MTIEAEIVEYGEAFHRKADSFQKGRRVCEWIRRPRSLRTRKTALRDPGATLGWRSLTTNGVNLLALRCIHVHTRELIYVTQRNIQGIYRSRVLVDNTAQLFPNLWDGWKEKAVPEDVGSARSHVDAPQIGRRRYHVALWAELLRTLQQRQETSFLNRTLSHHSTETLHELGIHSGEQLVMFLRHIKTVSTSMKLINAMQKKINWDVWHS